MTTETDTKVTLLPETHADLTHLEALFSLMRCHGVHSLQTAGVAVVMGPPPPPPFHDFTTGPPGYGPAMLRPSREDGASAPPDVTEPPPLVSVPVPRDMAGSLLSATPGDPLFDAVSTEPPGNGGE